MSGRRAKAARRERAAAAQAGAGDSRGRPAAQGTRGASGANFPGNTYEARDLPGLRARQVAKLARPPERNLTWKSYFGHTESGMQEPAHPAVTDPALQATLLTANEVRRLREAELYWMSPDMSRLCHALAPSMPPSRPGPADLPSPSGLMYFAQPLVTYLPWTRVLIGGRSAEVVEPDAPVSVCAVSWGPWDAYGAWPGGGTWFTFYTAGPRGPEEVARRFRVSLREADDLGVPPLVVDNEVACPASPDIHPHGHSPEAEALNSGTLWEWVHLSLCAFRILRSRSADIRGEPGPQHARARAARERVERPDEDVQVVDLRPRPAQRQAPAGSGTGTGRRSPDFRYPVRAFWRRQWYPRERVHRLIPIDLYFKGPEGAPVRMPKDRVYTLHPPARGPRPPAGPEPEL